MVEIAVNHLDLNCAEHTDAPSRQYSVIETFKSCWQPSTDPLTGHNSASIAILMYFKQNGKDLYQLLVPAQKEDGKNQIADPGQGQPPSNTALA